MRKVRSGGPRVDREKTRTAVSRAVEDVQHAARPEKHSVNNVLSWAVALAAGASVAWRSLHGSKSDTGQIDTPPKGIDPGVAAEIDKGAAPRDGGAPKHAELEARPEAGASQGKGTAAACPAKASGTGALAKELLSRFQTAECMTRAQALAFIGVLSLGPVLLFALAALGFVIRDTAQVTRFVHDLVGQLLPGRQASQAANNLIAQTHILESAQTLMKGKWWAVSIGLASLLWAAIGLFVGASDPMNVSWNVRETRGFVKLRLVAFGVFLAAGLLFLLSLVPSSLPSLIGRLQLPILNAIPPGAWWLELITWPLAILVDAAMFTVVYRFLPNTHVTWKAAMFGGLVAGVLWELFKKGFAVYLAHFGNFDRLYGTLGGAVLLVTWIWYSCVLLLVGSILCKMYEEHTQRGGVTVTPVPRAK